MGLRIAAIADARRPWAVPVVAVSMGVLWTGLMLVHLFAGGAVGLADQQDGNRLLCQLGVGNERPWASDTTGYLYPKWIAEQVPGEACGAAGSGEPYPSSQLVLLWLAKQLTPVLGYGEGLDLRVLGVVSAVVVGVLLALLTAVLQGRLWLRVAFVCAVGLVLNDSLFTGLFVSPFSEPAGLLGILALCVAILYLARQGRATWGALLAVAATLMWTITAKTQLMSFLPVVMAIMLWLPSHRVAEVVKGRRRPTRTKRVLRALRARVPALLLCVCVGLGTLSFNGRQSERLNDMVWYDAVFLEMLPHSDDPAAKLKSLGADPSLVSAMNTNINSAGSAASSPHWAEYRENVTPTKIVIEQLTDPKALLNKQLRGLAGVLNVKLDGFLGSYLPDSGMPEKTKETRWPLGGWLFELLTYVPLAIPAGGLLMAGMGLLTATRRRLTVQQRGFGVLALFLSAGCIGQFWTQMLTMGGSDMNKHMIFIGFMMMLGIPVLGAMWHALTRPEAARRPEDEVRQPQAEAGMTKELPIAVVAPGQG